ncbi:MAG: tubulin-like doman-containing protein [Gemmataceae bacterium]
MAVRIETNAEPIPGYKLIERIGGGGFGDVWKVEAPGGLLKAIKFVYGDLEDVSEDGHRAEQELKAMSRVKTVRHPYILSLERFDIIDGQLLIVMELADRNLWDRFKECRSQGLPGIPREELIRYMAESAEALDLMNNDYQLQHLDIKPQNIFLVHNHVKVADFGLVKDLEGMAASVTGGVTPVYAAPETFDGWVSRFSDQYSLGIVYQELLTGQRPFPGNNVRQLIMQHLQAAPNLSPLPARDRAAIGRALSKKPDDRHPSCTDLINALKNTEQSASSPDQTVQEVTPFDTVRPTDPPASSLSGKITEDMRGAAGPSAPTKAEPVTPVRVPAPTKAEPLTPVRAPAPTKGTPPVDQTPLPIEMASVPLSAPSELCGEGVLFPALLIGLGNQGLTVLQSVRQLFQDHFGSAESPANLTMLYIDTDPDTHRQAIKSPGKCALSPYEILLARLNRPSHYLKSRDGRTHFDTWIDPQMVYRIPRTQLTTGLRALGRLAFCDNYLPFTRRVRDNLAAIIDKEALPNATRLTRLGVRTNRPRVYIVTNLAGGTGSGMFLDVAYVVRSILKSLGYAEPHVTALLLLPEVDAKAPRVLPVANAHAALRELNFFSTGKAFTAGYHEREAVVQDSSPPFNRCFMLELPAETRDGEARTIIALAGDFLFRDMYSALGKEAESRIPRKAPGRGATFQTFGMYRLSSPRRPVVQQAAHELCLHMVQRWISKDAGPLRESVRTWVESHWTREEFGAETFIARLQVASERALKKAPEEVFAAIMAPLASRKTSEFDLDGVDQTLRQLQDLLGRPEEATLASKPATLEGSLSAASEVIVNEWGQRITELVIRLIEQPGYRLAGAEEAIRQIVVAMEQILQSYETITTELEKRTLDAFSRIHGILDGLDKNSIPRARVPVAIAELTDLLSNYAKWRYQHLILRQVIKSYISLRGNLSDELREINFCRNRLGELLKAFQKPAKIGSDKDQAKSTPVSPERKLLPIGCLDVTQAVQQVLETFSQEQREELENRLQAMLLNQFGGLVNVCMSPANLVKNLELALQQEAEVFVSAGHEGASVADLFFEQNPQEEQAVGEILTAYDEAAPAMAFKDADSTKELCLVAVPPGEAGDLFEQMVRRALPEANLAFAPSADDIVFYRQLSDVSLGDLEHLGPAGQDAYRQLSTVDHLTPHARMDFTFGN